jgi:ABC-2 type transport system permease protein
MSDRSNIVAVARREALFRVRTRSFVIGTVLLVLGVVALAFAPVLIGYFDKTTTQTVAVFVDTDLATDPVPTLEALLNAPTGTTTTGETPAKEFTVERVTDLAAAREAVHNGDSAAVLAIGRDPSGALAFTLYTDAPATGRTAQLIRQAATSVAVSDRLAQAGVDPSQQGALFQPPQYDVEWASTDRTGPTQNTVEAGTSYALGFGMTILIFMMIILYGNWVAMSVVEEKSSRVMEVILNAATPYQLLTGKVLGVGAVAGLQYLAILVVGGISLLLVAPVASAVLGDGTATVALPEGLTPELLLLFVVYGVLGFLVYAVLYAAAGSLVSRQEDVNQVVMPMTLISTAGYLIGVYAGTGLLDIRSGWVALLSLVPYFSPFVMLPRVAAGEATLAEVVISIAILIVTILGSLWVAARIYAVGVLLYGQRPGLRRIWQLARTGL